MNLRLSFAVLLVVPLLGFGCSGDSEVVGDDTAFGESRDAGDGGGDGTESDGGGVVGDGGGAGGPGDAEVDDGPGNGQVGQRCADDTDCAENLVCRGGVCSTGPPGGAVVRSIQFLSSGGGAVRSTGYMLRISIGVPQTAARSSSEHYTIDLGPRARQ